jgi:hypothetical protein
VPDFDYDQGILRCENQETTPPKNDEGSEREIALYGDVPEIIQDYIKDQRPPETDEEGREPVLTTVTQRTAKRHRRTIPPTSVRVVEPHITSEPGTSLTKRTEAARQMALNSAVTYRHASRNYTMTTRTKLKNTNALRTNSVTLSTIPTPGSITTDNGSHWWLNVVGEKIR